MIYWKRCDGRIARDLTDCMVQCDLVYGEIKVPLDVSECKSLIVYGSDDKIDEWLKKSIDILDVKYDMKWKQGCGCCGHSGGKASNSKIVDHESKEKRE